MAQGVTEIGDFNLSRFYRQASGIQWSRFKGKINPSAFEGRRSAYFLTEGKKVYVSNELPSTVSEAYSLLELHEALGATGYDDENYSLSTGLHLLSKMPDGNFRDEILRSFDRDLFQSSTGSGSGTSVGGGGDLTAISVKYAVLQAILKRYSKVNVSFLVTFPKIAFEPFYEKNQQFVALRYQADSKNELISVYVPALTWNKSPGKRRAIIEDLIVKVTDIFPAVPGVKMYKVSAMSCANGKTVLFPKSNSTQTQLIQAFRADFITGCETILQYRDIRAPSFKLPSEISYPQEVVKDPSKSPYTCEVKLSGGKVLMDFEMATGRVNSKAHITYGARKWRLFNRTAVDTMLTLQVVANSNGYITQIFLDLKDAHSKATVLEHAAGFIEGDKIFTRFKTTDGHRGSLSCHSLRGL